MSRRQKGVVLIFGVVLLFALTAVVIAYISLVSSETKHIGYQISDAQALYLAEAGIQKAVWILKYNKDWRGEGETGSLSSGKTYTITHVDDADFIGTTADGFAATASSNTVGHVSTLVIDNNMSTYWESDGIPGAAKGKGKKAVEESIDITFPYAVSIDRARFRLDSANSDQIPVDYIWSVKGEHGNWTDVLSVTNNSNVDRTDPFGVQDNVMYLRLLVTKAGNGNKRVIVAEIESPYLHIESLGTVQYVPNVLTKTVSRDFLITPGSPNTITAIEYSWQEK